MQPEYEPKTLEQAIGYAIEEAGELQSALGKTLRWGWKSFNPELPLSQHVVNAEWVRAEMLDMEGAIFRLRRFMDDAGL